MEVDFKSIIRIRKKLSFLHNLHFLMTYAQTNPSYRAAALLTRKKKQPRFNLVSGNS